MGMLTRPRAIFLILVVFLAALTSEAFALTCPIKPIQQQLVSSRSSISFKFSTPAMSGAGRFTSYIGRLSLCTADVTASSLSFTLDPSEVRFESMPPSQQLVLAGIVATLSSTQVRFQSTEVSKAGTNGRLKVSGTLQAFGKRYEVSFPVDVIEKAPSRSKFQASLASRNLDSAKAAPAAAVLGGLSGSADVTLVFSPVGG